MRPDDLIRDLEPLRTLAGVVPWALARTPPAEFVEVVVQDEFTHDVIVLIAPDMYVVFDTT